MKSTQIKLYTDISGNDISIRTYSYGKGDKAMYIQGGIHGGEVTYYIFDELHRFLVEHETELKKQVTLVPLVNPVAWNQRVYYYTAGKFDLYKGKDWNRSYPGGESSLSARNSRIVTDLALPHDLVIDLHTARVAKPYGIFLDDTVFDLITVANLPFNLTIDIKNQSSSAFKGTLNDAVAQAGKQALAIECGSHDSYEPENIQTVLTALKSLLAHMGVVKTNQTKQKNEIKTFNKVDVIYSPVSGFVKYYVFPQEAFKKGTLLCEILQSSTLGNTKKIYAPSDGWMFELARTNITWVGDELVRIIADENIHIR